MYITCQYIAIYDKIEIHLNKALISNIKSKYIYVL